MSSRRRERGERGTAGSQFEIIGKDAEKLSSYYSDLFGWKIQSDNPFSYGIVPREDNVSSEGIGIGGGIGVGPEGYSGHVTFYIEVPDVKRRWRKLRASAGRE